MSELLDCLHEALDLVDVVLYEMEMDGLDRTEEYKARCDFLDRLVDMIEKYQKGERYAS